jgi:hypothetical protein
MNRILLKGACLAAGVALFATPAQADRRTSLAGNDLIQDADDVFLFPQALHTYQNRLTLDLGMAEGSGGGLFSMGNDTMTFGAAMHRGPQEQLIVGWGSPDGSSARNREQDGQSGFGLALPGAAGVGGAPIENIDLLFGMKISDALDLGLRLGVGRGMAWSETEVPDGDGTRTDTTYDNQNAINLRLGASYKSGSLHLDNAIHVVALSGAKVVDGKNTVNASDTHFGLSTRGYLNISKGFDVGAVLGFNTGSGWAVNNADPDTEVTSIWTNTNVTIGAGPRVQIDDGPLVAAYAVINYNAAFNDPDTYQDSTDDTSTENDTVIPGLRMSAEYKVKPWITTRVGMEYNFTNDADYGFAGGNSVNTIAYASDFGWNAGMGFNFDKLQIDATLNHGSLYFLWQDAPFAMVSATYSFGAPKGSSSRRPSRRSERSERIDREAPSEPAEEAPAEQPVDNDDDF